MFQAGMLGMKGLLRPTVRPCGKNCLPVVSPPHPPYHLQTFGVHLSSEDTY